MGGVLEEIRSPKAEVRKKAENRRPKAELVKREIRRELFTDVL